MISLPPHPYPPPLSLQVFVMGQGDMGQLGLGEDIVERKKPHPVGGVLEGSEVIQVVCGGMHTVVLTKDGKVGKWLTIFLFTLLAHLFLSPPFSSLPPVLLPASLPPSLPLPLALSPWQVFTWGCNDEGALGREMDDGEEFNPGVVAKLEGVRVVQVSAGDSHTAALTDTGSIYCWGVFRVSGCGLLPGNWVVECIRGKKKGRVYFKGGAPLDGKN